MFIRRTKMTSTETQEYTVSMDSKNKEEVLKIMSPDMDSVWRQIPADFWKKAASLGSIVFAQGPGYAVNGDMENTSAWVDRHLEIREGNYLVKMEEEKCKDVIHIEADSMDDAWRKIPKHFWLKARTVKSLVFVGGPGYSVNGHEEDFSMFAEDHLENTEGVF